MVLSADHMTTYTQRYHRKVWFSKNFFVCFGNTYLNWMRQEVHFLMFVCLSVSTLTHCSPAVRVPIATVSTSPLIRFTAVVN